MKRQKKFNSAMVAGRSVPYAKAAAVARAAAKSAAVEAEAAHADDGGGGSEEEEDDDDEEGEDKHLKPSGHQPKARGPLQPAKASAAPADSATDEEDVVGALTAAEKQRKVVLLGAGNVSRSAFESRLMEFYENEGMQQCVDFKRRPPTLGGLQVPLHRLFVEVAKRGGSGATVRNKKWAKVAAVLCGVGMVPTSGSYQLKVVYTRYLADFEELIASKAAVTAAKPAGRGRRGST